MGRPAFVAEQILEAAFTRFATDGFDAVSSRDVAAAAGVGAASMFRHFPSMEALGRAVYARALTPWQDELSAWWEGEANDGARLARLVRMLYEAYDQRPKALALLVFPPHGFLPPECDVHHSGSLRARVLRLAQGDEDRAALLWGALTGPLQDRFLRQRSGAMTDHVAAVTALVLRLLDA